MNLLFEFFLVFICLFLCSCKPSELTSKNNGSGEINISQFLDENMTEHTKGFQTAFDSAIQSGVHKIYIPKGVYFLDKVNIYPGLEIYGDGRGQTILKKVPNARKFSRMFTIQKQLITTKDTLYIHDLEFDGSRDQQGPYKKHQLEHQAIIFLGAINKSSEVLNVKIHNCYFHDGVGDAIHLHKNINANIYDCEAKDVFRGGVTLTGGNSILNIRNFKAWGEELDTGIDIEVDAKGFNNSRKVDVHIDDIYLGGDFDIGSPHGGSIYINNATCKSPPVRISGGPTIIENSTFNCGYTKSCYINFPKDLIFNKCIFNVGLKGKKIGYQSAFNIFWSKSKKKPKDLSLTFEGCQFNLLEKDNEKSSFAIVNSPQLSNSNNQLKLLNCDFFGQFDADLLVRGEGNYTFDSCQSTSLRRIDLYEENYDNTIIQYSENDDFQLRILSSGGKHYDIKNPKKVD